MTNPRPAPDVVRSLHAALVEGVVAALLLTEDPLTAEGAPAAVLSYARALGLHAEEPPFTSAS